MTFNFDLWPNLPQPRVIMHLRVRPTPHSCHKDRGKQKRKYLWSPPSVCSTHLTPGGTQCACAECLIIDVRWCSLAHACVLMCCGHSVIIRCYPMVTLARVAWRHRFPALIIPLNFVNFVLGRTIWRKTWVGQYYASSILVEFIYHFHCFPPVHYAWP